MKKILLSCVTCLLAIGLVTACNNDEEVVENDDGNTQESDDTGGDTGSGGDTTEVVTLSNYTLAFSFVNEEEEPVVLEEGLSLYLCGDWDNWASFLLCTEVEGVYFCTFETISVGTYEFKGIACPTETGGSWSGAEVILDEDGKSNAKFTVNASDGDDYVAETATYILGTSTGDSNPGGEDPETITINIVTKNTGSEATKQFYVTGGDAAKDSDDDGDDAYWNKHYTMASTTGTELESYGDQYYAFEDFSTSTDLKFCVHYIADGEYWESAIFTTEDVEGTDENYMFWTYWNAKEGDWWSASYMGFALTSLTPGTLAGLTSLTLVLEFDYSSVPSQTGENVQIISNYTIIAE